MSSQENSDSLFWLAYCDLIKKQLGTGFNPERFGLFFATKSLRGPPAGDDINAAYTNAGIYDLANNLLDPGNLFYSSTNMNKYTETLLTYLDWVDLVRMILAGNVHLLTEDQGGNPGFAELQAIKNAEQDMDTALHIKTSELKKAKATYDDEALLGVTGGMDFPAWVRIHALRYIAADQAYSAAAAAHSRALSSAYGAMGSRWTTDKQQVVAATSSSSPLPGLNMPCTSLDPLSAREILNAYRLGKKVPDPTALYYNAEFRAPSYNAVVKQWQMLTNTNVPKSQEVLNINKGREAQNSHFGQTKAAGDASMSFLPWISFGAAGQASHQDESFNTDTDMSNISIEVFWADLQRVPVTAGKWDIGNPKARYPNLKAGAPLSAQTLVRPSELVLASRLGFKVKFGSTLASSFDQKVSDDKSAGGIVNVFGIPLKIGSSVSESTTDSSHTGKWDSTSGELTIEPTTDGGFATIIAIIGEKINTQ